MKNIEQTIVEMQQLSIDAGHDSQAHWFEHYLSYSEQIAVKRWCLRNCHTSNVALHAIQQIRGCGEN